MITAKDITDALQKVRSQAPLVHNITNYVVMNNTANALLSIGASPVMAHALEEVEDMVSIASALVINMGTLSEKWVEAMLLAGRKATEKNIPVIFDPVGVGATPYRNRVAKKIIEVCHPTIIRANASEIIALSDSAAITKGVDSTSASDGAINAAKILAQSANCVVVISGETDFITNGDEIIGIGNGAPIMSKVTGMGCTASALTGAFAAVEKNPLLAAVAAMAVMGVAGERAAQKSAGPGSMQMHFLDELFLLSETLVSEVLNLSYH